MTIMNSKRHMTRWMRLSVMAAAVLVMTVATVPAAETETREATSILRELSTAFSTLARNSTPAVVFIQVEKDVEAPMRGGQNFQYNNPFDLFGDDFMRRFFGAPQQPRRRSPRRFRQMGQGSGFLISEDGYILTNNHIVGDADRITVTLSNGKEYEATRIGTDAKSEVAVIRIEGDGFPYLEPGDSDELDIGEWVVAIGNPFGLAESVTAGIVSAKGRNNMGIADYENFIQTDAAINPGNSGGPLLNSDGEVVGINTAIFSRSGGYMGIGFAIPINMARTIKDQLVESGKVVRGYLGVRIQNVDEDMAASFDLEEAGGVLISQVEEGTAAAEAGLEEGDVVLRLDGEPVANVSTFRNAIAARLPGTAFTLQISRHGDLIDIEATAGEMPGEDAVADGDVEDIVAEIGFAITELTPEISQQTGYKPGDGVIVSNVELGGEAWRAGIRQGTLIVSVNREPVTNLKDFARLMGEASDDDVVLLKVRDGDAIRYLTLRLDD